MDHSMVSIYGEYIFSVSMAIDGGGSLRSSLNQLTQISNQGFVGRKLREEISRISADNQSFCDAFGCPDVATLANLQRANLKTTAANRNDDECVTSMRETFQHELIKTSVLYTTGPGRIMMNLLPDFTVLPDVCTDKIAPSSFQNYEGLSSAFTSENSLPLHSVKDTYVAFKNGERGEISDLSWLKKGMDAIHARETKMDTAAGTIQRAYRKHVGDVRKAHQDPVNVDAFKPHS